MGNPAPAKIHRKPYCLCKGNANPEQAQSLKVDNICTGESSTFLFKICAPGIFWDVDTGIGIRRWFTTSKYNFFSSQTFSHADHRIHRKATLFIKSAYGGICIPDLQINFRTALFS